MNIEQLKELESIGELQFSLYETSVITGHSECELSTGDAAIAYMRGRLKAQAMVRESILQMARQGAAPAQKQFLELAAKSAPEMLEEE